MGKKYEKFDLKAVAKRGEQFIINMTDEKLDHLPYWYVQIQPLGIQHTLGED